MGFNSTQTLDQIAAPQNVEMQWPEPTIPKPIGGDEEIDYLRLILNSRVYDVASETPLTAATKV